MPNRTREEEPVERTRPYKDNSGAFIRIAVLALAAIAIGGAVAYTEYGPRAPADQVAAITPTPSAPLIQTPPAVPPAPILEEKPAPAPAAKSTAHTPSATKTKAPVSDGPVPAPLVGPSSAAPSQTIDVDPKTPDVLTPIPEQVAPGAP